MKTPEEVVDSAFIYPQQGLGDHLLCNGLYREISRNFNELVIAVKKNYAGTVTEMLYDLKNIRIQTYPVHFWKYFAHNHAQLMAKQGYKVFFLGNFENGFLESNQIKFDEGFYLQAGIDFRHRWDSFKVIRNYASEKKLLESMDLENKRYIFVHDDYRRQMNIDNVYLPGDLPVIRPSDLSNGYSFFDYIMLIENAKEFHGIESSFVALVEGLNLDLPKFAHRYARIEAKTNSSLEFTYRNKWTIIS